MAGELLPTQSRGPSTGSARPALRALPRTQAAWGKGAFLCGCRCLPSACDHAWHGNHVPLCLLQEGARKSYPGRCATCCERFSLAPVPSLHELTRSWVRIPPRTLGGPLRSKGREGHRLLSAGFLVENHDPPARAQQRTRVACCGLGTQQECPCLKAGLAAVTTRKPVCDHCRCQGLGGPGET